MLKGRQCIGSRLQSAERDDVVGNLIRGILGVRQRMGRVGHTGLRLVAVDPADGGLGGSGGVTKSR